ncbi:MAG TPA: hypothetical protein VMU84_20400 [Thermoanaerobaculia bacterium]|nr:hypothetical protein [Thermoanaerobaculia bacterium]
MRKFIAVLLLATTLPLLAAPKAKPAAPKAKPVVSVAPKEFPHPIALFLASLSAEGKNQVTFKASAVGMRFYFEEPTGVTVYVWDNGEYRKEEFLKGMNLAKAVKRYSTIVESH